jgi:chitosanase
VAALSGIAIVASAVLAGAVAIAAGSAGAGGTREAPAGRDGQGVSLSKEQRMLADEVVSVFENDTPQIQYDYMEARHDGRGYAAGRAAFRTGRGDLLQVIQTYTATVHDNPLAGYLPALRKLADAGSDSGDGLDGLPAAWRAAARDPKFRAVQDQVVDQLYFGPALDMARRAGLRTALGVVIVYDATVQHGNGDDPDSVGALIERASQRAGGSPADGVAEQKWLADFLAVRTDDLNNPYNVATGESWAQSVGRVEALQSLLAADNDDLQPPLSINPYGTPHVLFVPSDGDDGARTEPSQPEPRQTPSTTTMPPKPRSATKLKERKERKERKAGPRPPTVPKRIQHRPATRRPPATAKRRPPVHSGRPAVPAVPSNTVLVSNTEQLRLALARARPGQTIRLRDGVYQGIFDAKRSGTSAHPITLTGSRRAVLRSTGYGFHLEADHWRLVGFTISDSLKGIVLDGAHHNLLDRLLMQRIAQEGVHLRRNSTDNLLIRSTIVDTGRTAPDYGRAVTIGLTSNLWPRYTNGLPDRSDRNRIVGNVFGPNARGGGVAADEGTTAGQILANLFIGTQGQTNWLEMRATGYRVAGNAIRSVA